jgi:subtilisin family serine protease
MKAIHLSPEGAVMTIPARRYRRRHPAGALALVLVATMATGATPASAAETHELTLITGDRVQLVRYADGREAVTVTPAERDVPVAFEAYTIDGQNYVVPSDAAPLIPDLLDRELFNVSKLADYGYHDGVPVIVDYDSPVIRTLAAPAGATVTRELPSIDAVAMTIAPDGEWWSAATRPGIASTGALTGGAKVWLDELAEVVLDTSVPLIGAPEAWADGFDGTGVTVAVLDTGIDDTHPDLAGKVIAAENFTADPDTRDEHGHGTHVAGTVAGSGAASGGKYVGVAPGARLLNGKVCNSFGSCPDSAIIAGMEWAAAQGADIANLSLGGGPTDGTDPLSQAVNQLTAEHDILFVIAAGNSGFLGDGSVASPGAADAALTVGSVTKTEQLSPTSSRGPRVGDFAIKPDITAPGVDIIAPRAEGTALGPIVDEFYTQISGTSMATPHVAGAAAIALQKDPSLSAPELKALLATTASPNPDLEVYQQGGGRVDVPSALGTPVLATPSPVNLGYFPYPQDDAEPVTVEVTYTNRTDQALTLDLTLEVTSREGAVPGPDMLSVSPSTLTVAPGGSAQATVTVDPTVGEFGLYGGYLVATVDGDVATRTPVGFYKESERYNLTVQGIARDGRPAFGISAFDVANVDDMSTFLVTSLGFGAGGETTVRVPPGTYSVLGVIYTYDEPQVFVNERVFAGVPEVEVTGDTTVVLDARDANPIDFVTEEDVQVQVGVTLGWFRSAEQFGSQSHTHTGLDVRQFATPTDPVTHGEFEFFSRHRLVTPQLLLEVVDPVQKRLSPQFMTGSPVLNSDRELPLVYAGLGFPEDYEGVDAEGKVVLVRRGELTFAEKEANAAAAGAVAIVVANNVSGQFAGTVGDSATIPTITLSMEEGDELLALLDQGDVTVRLAGHSISPFMYDLVLPHPERVPEDLTFVADKNELATVDTRYHSDVADHQINEVRHFFRPWSSFSFGFATATDVPQRRDEYLVAGDTRYQQQLWAEQPFTGMLQHPVTFYSPGEQRQQNWFRQVLRPGVLNGGPFQASLPTVRVGDVLQVRILEWVDASGNYGELDGQVDTASFRLYENGQLIGEAGRAFGDFAVSPAPAEHRLELDVTRTADWWQTSTHTRTAWTLQSEPVAGTQVVPLLELDYDADVDLLNTAPHPRDRRGPATLGITVRHQPGADGDAIAGARLWVSYDDGATWLQRPGQHLGDGKFRFVLSSRDPEGTSGYVSLRVEAWDVDGNRIEQEITRAWRLAPR